MENIYLVISTFDTQEQAKRVGNMLVEELLAACSQVSGPIESSYVWKGTVEEEVEFKLTLKVCGRKLERAQARLQQLHSYETPMIVTIEVNSVNQAYLDWACCE